MFIRRFVASFLFGDLNYSRLTRSFKFRAMSSCSEESKRLVAITQMCATCDKSANMRQVQTLIEKAKEQSACFVFLPECCDFVGENREQTLELAEPLTGPTMQRYQELAKKHQIWLSLGGLHESILDEYERKTNKIYNAHVVVDDCGKIFSVYRKLHLFDVETAEFTFRESKVVCGGQQILAPIETPIGRLGLQICYDMRFAETGILLRKAGAEILSYPSAFAYITGKAHWETLLRARAIENQCYVLAAAQIGWHNDKRRSWGHAMAVNPWGKVLLNMKEEELAVNVVEIDQEEVESVRKSMPCFEHRRDDVYSLTAYDCGTIEAQEDRCFAENIIKKETIFYESPLCYAFTNLRCVVEGHILVAVKRRAERLKDLNSSEISDLFNTVCRMQRMLETIYKTTAATVTVQDGPDAGQTVSHVHFHVMPRRPADFKHNDQIYVKLEDQSLANDVCERSLEERIKEAQIYREVLRTMKS